MVEIEANSGNRESAKEALRHEQFSDEARFVSNCRTGSPISTAIRFGTHLPIGPLLSGLRTTMGQRMGPDA